MTSWESIQVQEALFGYKRALFGYKRALFGYKRILFGFYSGTRGFYSGTRGLYSGTRGLYSGTRGLYSNLYSGTYLKINILQAQFSACRLHGSEGGGIFYFYDVTLEIKHLSHVTCHMTQNNYILQICRYRYRQSVYTYIKYINYACIHPTIYPCIIYPINT